MKRSHQLGFETRLMHVGRDPERHFGAVNTPSYPSSTILSSTLDDYLETPKYGRLGTETSRAAEMAAAEIEGAEGAVVFPSGLAAVCGALQSVLKTGDHLIVADNVYGPTRKFCDEVLTRFGVEVSYFNPLDHSSVTDQIRPNSRAVYLESPGSLTFEVADTAAISAIAHEVGLVMILDNTWGAGVFFRAFQHGVDIAVHSGSKYWGGHSDLMMGFVVANGTHLSSVRNTAVRQGVCVSPDVCYLFLRGIRSLPSRLARHQQTGLDLANWLTTRPEVRAVVHPALKSCPGHTNWKRDFSGSSSLFGVVLDPLTRSELALLIDALELFGIGDSWGGYESLIVPVFPQAVRLRPTNLPEGTWLRVHTGLEASSDLITDLEIGFMKIAKTFDSLGRGNV